MRGQRLLAEGAQRALAATDPRRAAADLRRATDLVAELARTRPQAPMTPLNRPIGPNRRYATARAGLAELKAAAKAHGATVNDAILAVVAGALRRYLAADPPSGRPVALVPVSVRRPGEEGGNRISTVLVDLPTDEADPAARLATHQRRDARAQGLGRGARRRAHRRRQRLGAAAGLLDPRPGHERRARVQPRRLQRARAPAAVLAQRPATARGLPGSPPESGQSRASPSACSATTAACTSACWPTATSTRRWPRCTRRSRRPSPSSSAGLRRPRTGNGPSARPVRPAGHQEEGSHGTSGT